MVLSVTVEPSFRRAVKKLPPDRACSAIEALPLFMQTPMLPRLAFRPLKGKKDYFIIDARHGDRIILKKLAEDTYAAVDVGPHDNVYRRWNRLKK